MFKKVAEKNLTTHQSGQALIELVLAIAIATVLLGVLTTGIISAREGFARSEKILEANIMLQKEIEALRSAREPGWNSFSSPGTYHTEQSGDSWVAVAGTIIEGDYTRGFTVADVCRQDATSSPIDCSDPQAIVDPSTKEITATVSWSFLGTQSVSSTFYLSRYSDNTTWVQTSDQDFNAGTHNNTKTKKNGVELDSAGGDQTFTDSYDTSGDYTFDPNKIEVVGGFAQLKAQGSTVSGQSSNSGFDSGIGGWSFSIFERNKGQSGNYQSSGGNPGGYVDINFPANKKDKAGGYWYQPFTTTIDNPTATLTFDWQISAYDPDPDSFHLYAFVDTGPGEPNIADNVWDSGDITGTSSWSSTVTVDVSSKITTPGTYHIKVAAYVDYPKKVRGPFTAGFDNVLLSWSGAVGSYPNDSPTIYRTTSFSAPSITEWKSFTEVAQKDGGSIGYQLSDNDGVSWKYFNGSSWVDTTSSYNDAPTINNNIASFPTTNNKIDVKAFLISDGTQFVRLDNVDIVFTGSSTGTYTSASFDAGDTVSFNRIFWTEVNFASTTTSLQIAANTDNSTWEFVGPDGTENTYFTGGSGMIPLNTVSGKYFRYRIDFTSTNKKKPRVNDVTLNYSP